MQGRMGRILALLNHLYISSKIDIKHARHCWALKAKGSKRNLESSLSSLRLKVSRMAVEVSRAAGRGVVAGMAWNKELEQELVREDGESGEGIEVSTERLTRQTEMPFYILLLLAVTSPNLPWRQTQQACILWGKAE